jgi:hypothetical protein
LSSALWSKMSRSTVTMPAHSDCVGRVDMERIASVGGANDPDDFLVVLGVLEVVPRPRQLIPCDVKILPPCSGGRSRRRDVPRPQIRVVRKVHKLYAPITRQGSELFC